MTITFIPDLDFHQRVDDALKGILEADPDSDREGVDRSLTEGLLAEGIWPETWRALMPDHDKVYLIERIVGERRERS